MTAEIVSPHVLTDLESARLFHQAQMRVAEFLAEFETEFVVDARAAVNNHNSIDNLLEVASQAKSVHVILFVIGPGDG